MDKKLQNLMILKLKKYKFHWNKSPTLTNDIDINEIAVSNKLPFVKKDFIYFIGKNDDKKIRPLYIFFSNVSACRIYFDETPCMYFCDKRRKRFW